MLEIEALDSLSDAGGEGIDLAAQPVVRRQLLTLTHQRTAFLLQPSLSIDNLLVPHPELGRVDCFHLIEIDNASAFALGLL